MNVKYYPTIRLLLLLSTGLPLITWGQEATPDSSTKVTFPGRQSYLSRPIAYGVQPAWKVTGALSTVGGSDLQKNFTTNLANTLFGRIPGLTVGQNGGEPGNDSPSLTGRGVGTFGPGRNLLVMVDGFESPFEQLSPDEIESISLLKDASATAIYGLRGANGVLLVTTKRGSDGPLVVNFSTQQGFHTASRLPQFLNSYDYARLYNEGLKNDGRAPLYTDADLEAYRTGSDPFLHPNVNWYEEVLKKNGPDFQLQPELPGGQQHRSLLCPAERRSEQRTV